LLSRQLQDRAESPKSTRVSFMKVVELQRRGLPHFHAVIRLDAASQPDRPPSPPDTSIGTGDFAALVRRAAVAIEIKVNGDRILRFGDQFDIKIIRPADAGESGADISSRQIAAYLAKYVTKSVADFGILARRFSPAAIDQLNVTEHVREILRAIVTVAEEEDCEEMLSWVHTLGYRGHVMSKSRQFSTTMTALRERRAAWRKEQQPQNCAGPVGAQNNSGPPMQWEFERVGHISLGDRVLAVSAFDRAREQRFAARRAVTEESEE
jgi:hypothetical protein